MITMKRIFLATFLMHLLFVVTAQQQTTYTQYMFNGLAINPAYAGSHDALSFTALGRWQWVGMKGAPNTQTFAVHSPIQSKHMALGLMASRDEIAVTTNTTVMADYAYRIAMGGGYLSMGLQGGFQSYRANYSDAYTINTDPTFQKNISSFSPNFGAGLFYYNPIWYAGVSVPEIVKTNVENGGQIIYTQERHYFFTGGVVFILSPSVKMKPNVLVKVVEGSPVAIDYNVNFLLKEILWLGASYRSSESVDFLAEINLNQQFRIGYALDLVTNSTLRNSAGTSHELLLNYRISLSKDKVVTPRYF